jgi:hypothetical protein
VDALETAIAHYGVKGMHWGVRKDTTPTDVSVTQKPGKRVRATGGKNQPASDDAKRAAESRRKARASTVDALSNQELQQLVNRMNLEQQLSRLSEGQTSAGKKFAKVFLGDYGKRKFFDYADEAVAGNPDFGAAPKPRLKPVVDSLKTATGYNNGGGKKKEK